MLQICHNPLCSPFVYLFTPPPSSHTRTITDWVGSLPGLTTKGGGIRQIPHGKHIYFVYGLSHQMMEAYHCTNESYVTTIRIMSEINQQTESLMTGYHDNDKPPFWNEIQWKHQYISIFWPTSEIRHVYACSYWNQTKFPIHKVWWLREAA